MTDSLAVAQTAHESAAGLIGSSLRLIATADRLVTATTRLIMQSRASPNDA
jgi:hypothetical protein